MTWRYTEQVMHSSYQEVGHVQSHKDKEKTVRGRLTDDTSSAQPDVMLFPAIKTQRFILLITLSSYYISQVSVTPSSPSAPVTHRDHKKPNISLSPISLLKQSDPVIPPKNFIKEKKQQHKPNPPPSSPAPSCASVF